LPYHISGGKRDPRVPIKHNEIWHALDGDPAKLALQDNSPDGKFLVTLGMGRPVNPKSMPTRFRRQGNNGLPIYDIDGAWGGFCVVERFKDIVEAFEPGVHQFLPFEIEQGGEVIAKRHLFYICNRLDTLAKDQCRPPVEPGRNYMPNYDGNDVEVFERQKIGDHHAWCDRSTIGNFVSNQLFDAIQAENFTGLGFKRYDEV